MQKLLFLGYLVLIGGCALISFAKDFEDVPETTVAEIKKMPENKMAFLQGHLNNHTFSDATGVIKTENTFHVDPTQKIEILARVHNSLFHHKIDIITLSPL